jgi:hypothetical protein
MWSLFGLVVDLLGLDVEFVWFGGGFVGFGCGVVWFGGGFVGFGCGFVGFAWFVCFPGVTRKGQ